MLDPKTVLVQASSMILAMKPGRLAANITPVTDMSSNISMQNAHKNRTTSRVTRACEPRLAAASRTTKMIMGMNRSESTTHAVPYEMVRVQLVFPVLFRPSGHPF